jgi:hypothetical protein
MVRYSEKEKLKTMSLQVKDHIKMENLSLKINSVNAQLSALER